MPKKGADSKKLKKIKIVLKKNPDGLWIREIARLTGLDKSLVSRYLNKYLKNEIDETFPLKNKFLKIVKLK